MQGKITTYTQKRYYSYIIIACIALILPFITIEGKHFFLLSFDHKKLDLFFISFNTQELYLMPLVLIGLFLFIFFITTLGGRIWCAWSCPQTIFRVIYRDLIQTKLLKIGTSIVNKQKNPNGHFLKKILAVLFFYILALLAVSNFLWYFVPPEDFFLYIQEPSEHTLLMGILIIASLLFTLDITFLKENFCIYVCPYARIQSVMFDSNTLQVIYDEQRGGKIFDKAIKLHKKPPLGDCTGCEACVAVCPTHIDIRRGMQLECINCLECADACSKIQNRFNRPSLISWSSFEAVEEKKKTKYFRFRTIAYIIVLAFVALMIALLGSTKEHMLLNINRSSELYSIDSTNSQKQVSNAYIFTFENTDIKDHKYYFEAQIEGLEDAISIEKPKQAFEIKAGAKVKKIVVLKANQDLAKSQKEDSIYPLQIRAFSQDDPEIQVIRESIFAYPKKELIHE